MSSIVHRDVDGNYWVYGPVATKAELPELFRNTKLTSWKAIRITKQELMAALDSQEIGEIALEWLKEKLGAAVRDKLDR